MIRLHLKTKTKMHNMVEANFYSLLISTLLIILLIIKLIFTNKKRWTNLPPSPPSFPILGHLPLLKQPLHETLHHFSRKFGPVMMLRFGVKRALVVSSPSLVEECFTKTNDIIFANRPLVPSAKHINYNFTSMGAAPYGHSWRSQRRVCASELLSTTRLSSTTCAREHEVKLMCAHIYKVSSQKVELKSMFRDLMNNVTTMSMIGKRYHGDVIDSEDVESAPRFRDIMEEVLKLLHTPYAGDFLPFFAWIDFGGLDKKMIAVIKRVDVFFDEVIENRRRVGNSESGIMVDKLLGLQEQEPELYTDQIIRGLILLMLIAGTETPYLTLEWAMSLLLNHPNAMKKIKNEIDTHVGTHRLLQEDDLEKLSYLQNVINESLRLCPTLPMLLPREASQDTQIGGYDVPSGTMLMVNAWAIQRDPALWDKPDEFIPERFEVRLLDDKYKMLAFSAGRRGCPGTSLGYRILGLAIGTLIQAFEWEKIGDEPVDMNAFYGLSMAKLTPLQALCKPRSNMIPLFV